jgi:hypothetical protein
VPINEAKKVIYALKKERGVPIQIEHRYFYSPDYDTGKAVARYQYFHIQKAIVLRAEEAKDFVYDLSYIASSKNFTYGGYFEKDVRVILFDAKEIEHAVTTEDYVIYDKKKWDVRNIITDTEKSTVELLVKAVNYDQ